MSLDTPPQPNQPGDNEDRSAQEVMHYLGLAGATDEALAETEQKIRESFDRAQERIQSLQKQIEKAHEKFQELKDDDDYKITEADREHYHAALEAFSHQIDDIEEQHRAVEKKREELAQMNHEFQEAIKSQLEDREN